MHQPEDSKLDLTLESFIPDQQLTPHVDKAVSVIGLVEKERKLYKNQAKDYKRRIQECELRMAENEREARETQAKLKKTIAELTESRDTVREQLASSLLNQEDLERDKAELRKAIFQLQSMTTSLWRTIPDLLKRTAKSEECSDLELTVKESDVSMDASDPTNNSLTNDDISLDESLERSLIYYSPTAAR